MGRDSNLKDLRKQLKNVVQASLPEIVASQAFEALNQIVISRIQTLDREIKEMMTKKLTDIENLINAKIEAKSTPATEVSTEKDDK